MSNSTSEHNTLLLSGLDGGNPLAFLAALGTLRTLTRVWPDQAVAMSWKVQGGVWTPGVHAGKPMTQQCVVDTLVQTLQSDAAKHPIAFMIKNGQVGDNEGSRKAKKDKQPQRGSGGDEPESADTPAASDSVRKLFSACAERVSVADREVLDWLSAMKSDVVLDPKATSQLQLVRRDYFPGNLKSVITLCTDKHLQRTLFQPWDYADPLDNQSLHFEPSEDRRHAHQWSKPSGDPDRKKRGGMLGANRLAIEAFPFFQSIAVKDKLATRGFSGSRRDDTRWTWPLWTCPVSADVVASLLALGELQSEPLDHRALSARGIQAIFRCRRILVEKTPNFTPAMAV